MISRAIAIMLIFVAILSGLLIYFTQRTASLQINTWLSELAGPSLSGVVKDIFSGYSLPLFLTYSLPDGLWMFALTMAVILIWDFQLHAQSLLWIVMVLLAGTAFECMQKMHWIIGWYDPVDIVFMVAGMLIPISFIKLKNRLCKTK